MSESNTPNLKKYILLLVAVVLVVLGLTGYLHYNNLHPSTDDAYVNAHIININAQVSGEVKHVSVSDHQYVKKGQLLFSLDPKPFTLKLQQAEANLLNTKQQVQAAIDKRNAAAASLTQAKANLELAKATYDRYTKLYAKHYLAKQTLDEQDNQLQVAQATVDNSKQQLKQAADAIGDHGKINAQIASAESAVNQARLNLQYTKVYAPMAGRIAQMSLHKGDSVNALQTAFNLIDNQHMWIDAHFKETQVGKMRVNMPVKVRVDMYPDKVFEGKIQSIAYGSGDSFSILPSQNDSGNWVKVTQRFTVKIKLIDDNAHYPLRVGSSASVRVES
jgi:membrane fusion protein (multidrug efflux system)